MQCRSSVDRATDGPPWSQLSLYLPFFPPFYFISYRLRWHIFCIYKMFDPIIFVEYFLYSLLHIHHRDLTDYLLSSCYFHPIRSHRNEFYTPCWSSSEFCLLWLFFWRHRAASSAQLRTSSHLREFASWSSLSATLSSDLWLHMC